MRQYDHEGEGIEVTVCVATISRGGGIFGASDRMLTSGNIIKYEPTSQTKIRIITRAVIVMVSGDAGIQSDILNRVSSIVNARIVAEPNRWWTVREVVDLYREHYNSVRSERINDAFLAPLGLNTQTFLQQKTLDSTFVLKVATAMMEFRLPGTSAIIVGIDEAGPHIYTVHDGVADCQDQIGFAAIGSGGWHASSHLMLAGYDVAKIPAEAMYLTYSAKRRAEVAPGVGDGTDVFLLGPQRGTFVPFTPDTLADLKKMYDRQQKATDKASKRAIEEVKKYVEEATKKTAEDTQTAPNPPGGEGAALSNGDAIRGGPEKG